MRDMILKDEDGVKRSYNNIVTLANLRGQRAGVDVAAKWLCNQAEELFKNRLHKEAIAFQNLADRLVSALDQNFKDAIENHKVEFPEVVPDDEPNKVAEESSDV